MLRDLSVSCFDSIRFVRPHFGLNDWSVAMRWSRLCFDAHGALCVIQVKPNRGRFLLFHQPIVTESCVMLLTSRNDG